MGLIQVSGKCLTHQDGTKDKIRVRVGVNHYSHKLKNKLGGGGGGAVSLKTRIDPNCDIKLLSLLVLVYVFKKISMIVISLFITFLSAI